MDLSHKRKDRDGNYLRTITTGDAVAKPSIAEPLEVLKSACGAAGGTLALRISAGKTSDMGPVVLDLGSERIALDRSELVSWSRLLNGAGTAYRGFSPIFAQMPFRDRAARAADAEPPFGLFSCQSGTGSTLWVAAIIPVEYESAYDLTAKVMPITASWIERRRMAAEGARVAERASAERQMAAAERARTEESRLRPFRAGLKVGSSTNCGMVIDVRGPLVQVQLAPSFTRPAGPREFWVRRDQLTDGPAPNGCRITD